LKVLDFSRVLAGSFAGRMMFDLGADVVKVEP
jgi:crotonobetainyl-CoA:carnitine CoA-transferase CaiB-like acyl-CoA transferase